MKNAIFKDKIQDIMKNNLLFLFSILLLMISCKEEKHTELIVDKSIINKQVVQDSNEYDLIKTNCYACHNPNSASHDNLIAPPMAAIKKRYLRLYDTKESFVGAVSKWTLNPSEDNAIMRGAVMEFNVMPKQNFKKEDVKKIATYIFENKLEEPEWFEGHERGMHRGNQKGMGRGMGRRN